MPMEHGLRSIPFFSDLSALVLDAISRRLQREHHQKGATIFLEGDEGIPLDMIAATSVGAVFGALYAAGRSIDEVIQFALNIQRQYNFFTGFRYWDFRLPPRSGLIRGNMILNYFRQQMGNKTFDDLGIPLYIVSADLLSGEEIVLDHGPVAEAMRASMSVIGIIEPAQNGGRFLIDGGAVNPVPTQLLADKGIDIIIASNVIPVSTIACIVANSDAWGVRRT